jgi:HAD superfamily hydrolase (TIGR01549 family)
MITTLFLDAGGVIVTPNWQRVSAALGAHGVTVAPAALERADPMARRDLDLGADKHTNDQQRGWLYFDLVLTYAGVQISERTQAALADLQVYHADQNLWETVPAGVPEALDAFKALGLKLVVVSNANGRARFLLERLGLASRLAMVFDSHEEGVEKPDPRFFQIAMARSGATPETTMHVGDLYHVDVEGARGAGLRPVLLDPLDLYTDFDCERVKSLGELAEKLASELSAR